MEFKLIRGGKDYEAAAYRFAGGRVTDTRLMGVLGLHLHWINILPESETPVHLHQFYYYDIEEIGLDSVKIFDFSDEASSMLAEKQCFGGLGAEMVPVNEKEARYLVQFFVNETKKRNLPIPIDEEQISFITNDPVTLSEEELSALYSKICVNIKTNYGAVNYYLMRLFGKDYEGAKLLEADGANKDSLEDISLPSHATFLRNNIDEFTDENGETSYLSESLTESNGQYFISVTEIDAKDGRVFSSKLKSRMNISTNEASLLLNTDEYVSVFEIVSDMDYFDMSFASFSVGTTKTEHETGELFMEFKPDNNHAEKKLFRLSDDVFAIYYVTDFGQLIMGAYSPFDSAVAESKLMQFFKPDLQCTGRYHFAQSIIYEFALSGFDDFEEFLRNIE